MVEKQIVKREIAKLKEQGIKFDEMIIRREISLLNIEYPSVKTLENAINLLKILILREIELKKISVDNALFSSYINKNNPRNYDANMNVEIIRSKHEIEAFERIAPIIFKIYIDNRNFFIF